MKGALVLCLTAVVCGGDWSGDMAKFGEVDNETYFTKITFPQIGPVY